MNFDDLVERGLVQKKSYTEGPYAGLSVFKYSRKVFYDALWNADPRLLEARGMVLDSDGNPVIWPFTKVFNYGENKTTCEPDRLVDVVVKLNGFMAAVTWCNGSLLVSTTGTLDSDYATLARKVITEQVHTEDLKHGHTYIFEICDPSDPHIIDEYYGAYLIGARRMRGGVMWTEHQLDAEAILINALRPQCFQVPFSEALEMVKLVEHEGFMVRDAWTNETIMKIKSPYYLTKKFLMRMGAGKTELMATNPTKFKESIDEEYYPLVDFISTSYRQYWKDMDQFERRKVIEDYFYGN